MGVRVFTWFNRRIWDLYWFRWHCCIYRDYRVNSIIVHVSSLPVLLSDPPFKLNFGGVSALGIIDYWHCHQLFIHWTLKVLIWFNDRLFVWYVHSITNIFSEMQISYFYTIAEYIFVHHYHDFLLYFVIIWCFHPAY